MAGSTLSGSGASSAPSAAVATQAAGGSSSQDDAINSQKTGWDSVRIDPSTLSAQERADISARLRGTGLTVEQYLTGGKDGSLSNIARQDLTSAYAGKEGLLTQYLSTHQNSNTNTEIQSEAVDYDNGTVLRPYITQESAEIAKAYRESGGKYTVQAGDSATIPLSGEAQLKADSLQKQAEFRASGDYAGAYRESVNQKRVQEAIDTSQTKTINPNAESVTLTETLRTDPVIGNAFTAIQSTVFTAEGDFSPLPLVGNEADLQKAYSERLAGYEKLEGGNTGRVEQTKEGLIDIGLTAATVGLPAMRAATLPYMGTFDLAVNAIPKGIQKVAVKGAETAGGLVGFGTLGNIGADNPVTEITSGISENLNKFSDDLINSNDPWVKAGGIASSVPLGIASGAVGFVGGTAAAVKGIGELAIGQNEKNVVDAAKDTVTGFIDYAKEGLTTNPGFTVGEFVGFSKSYMKGSKLPGKIVKKTGEEIGLIDDRIVNTGDTNLVPAQNPLLASAITSGAVDTGGMLRLDTAAKISVYNTGEKISVSRLNNKGSLLNIYTKNGKLIATAGESNPISKAGEINLHSKNDFPLYTGGKIKPIPFMYGTGSMNGAGTVLGLLDKSATASANKVASSVVNAVIPLEITTHRGRVISYNMNDIVKTQSDGKTKSMLPYTPGKWLNSYRARYEGNQNLNTAAYLSDTKSGVGFYPSTTPKYLSNDWVRENESEFAWMTKDKTNPVFETTRFGGFTTKGNKILKLGSTQSFLSILKENRIANKSVVKNRAVRPNQDSDILNLKKAPADVVKFFSRDVAFRIAENIGKPEGLRDITNHGAEHVEDVANIAKLLKDVQGKKFEKVSDIEIYYAGILHDAAKNTERENVPGGHGEMVGSVIRSGASLDARRYMKPEAVKEFESILGKKGVERYNDFLKGWDSLSDKQKKNIANAISEHTTNLNTQRFGLKGKAAIITSQHQRITTGKLSRLISDADRITLTSRYGLKNDPLRMFANQKTVNLVKEKYGIIVKTEVDTIGTSKIKASDILSNESVDNKVLNTYNYQKQTNQRGQTPYSGYKSGNGEYKITPPNYKPGKYGYSGKPYSKGNYSTGYKPSETYGTAYVPSNPYKGNYYSGGYKQEGSKYKGSISYGSRRIDDLVINKRKKEDSRKFDIDIYKAARRGRIDHLSLVDPLEFLGRGSLTNRNKADMTLYKEKIYLVDNAVTGKKPEGRRKK